MSEGLCLYIDPDLWFPDQGGSVRDVKAFCRQCPVISQCLEYALENSERYGVWGGKSEQERRKLLRQRRAAA